MFGNIAEKDVKIIAAWLQAGSLNIFGRPFSGKDTQGTRLAQLFPAPLIGGGDIIRGAKDIADVQSIMNSGKLIPQDDYLKIVLPYLQQEQFNGKPLVLS